MILGLLRREPKITKKIQVWTFGMVHRGVYIKNPKISYFAENLLKLSNLSAQNSNLFEETCLNFYTPSIVADTSRNFCKNKFKKCYLFFSPVIFIKYTDLRYAGQVFI